MYVCMYADCTVVVMPGDLCVVMSPAIWWRSVDLYRRGVTGLTFPKCIYDLYFRVLYNLTNVVMHTSAAHF